MAASQYYLPAGLAGIGGEDAYGAYLGQLAFAEDGSGAGPDIHRTALQHGAGAGVASGSQRLRRVKPSFNGDQATQHRGFNEEYGTCRGEDAMRDDDSARDYPSYETSSYEHHS